jgi:hypothetical protein
MRAILARLVLASLMAGTGVVRAADDEAVVTLTGIAHFNNHSLALLEIQPRPGRPVIKPILAEGERVAGVEVKRIDARSGRVQVLVNGVETFHLVGAGDTAETGPTLRFKSADLAQVLDIYQALSGRTVLRPSNVPWSKISIVTQTELTNVEAVRALDDILARNGLATRPRGDKFVFVVKADQTNRLSLIPNPPPAPGPITQALRRHVLPHIPASLGAAGVEIFPPGLVKFQDADVLQVLEICQELRGATLLCPSDLPHPKVSLRSETEMTRDEAIWMLDAALALGDIAIIPHGAKFFFALPGMGNSTTPAIESNPLAPAVNAAEVFPAGLLKFQSADTAQVLPVYATLLGRKPMPVDRTTPAVKLTIRSQTSLTRSEAVFALDALAAINRLKFALVEDDQVKVLPAALTRRETNPVQ